MRKSTLQLINAICGVVAGISIQLLGQAELYTWLVLPFVIPIGVLWLCYLYEKKKEVVALLMEVHEKLQVPSGTDLRCAVFIPSSRRKALKEYARYSNPKEHRQKCKMLISQGVAGRCYRTKEQCNVPIMKGTFSDQHVRELGFMPEEAERFKQDRESYLCIPLQNESGDVSAILSLDSSKNDTFTNDRINNLMQYLPQFRAKLVF